jgi:hypothetical protein
VSMRGMKWKTSRHPALLSHMVYVSQPRAVATAYIQLYVLCAVMRFGELAQACRRLARKHILRSQLVVLSMARQDAQRRPRRTGFWIKNLLGAKRLAAQACGNSRAAPISAYYAMKESTRMAGTWQRWSGIGSRSRRISAIHKRRPVAVRARNHN